MSGRSSRRPCSLDKENDSIVGNRAYGRRDEQEQNGIDDACVMSGRGQEAEK